MARGSIRKRGENSWEIRVRAGRDPVTGQYRRIYRTVRGSYDDAVAELDELIAFVSKGGRATSRISLKAWLVHWLERCADRVKAGKLKIRTLVGYEQICRVHLIPRLGHLRLGEIEPEHIQAVYNAALDSHSPTTVNNWHRVLHAALQAAVKDRLITTNPCAAAEPPAARKITRTPEPDDVARLLNLARRSQYWLPLVLMATTGMRVSEAFGLRWEDIDFDRDMIRLERQLLPVDNRLIEQDLKNRNSRRVILYPEITQLLRRHKSEQAANRLAAGAAWEDHGLVFANTYGRPMSRREFYRRFDGWRKKAGLDWLRPHDLRHHHASVLIAAGIPLTVVAERLGHRSLAVTTQVYAHVLPSLQETFLRGGNLGAILPGLEKKHDAKEK